MQQIKVGTKIRITKSKINWNTDMDQYIGKIVTVTKVRENEVRFKNDDGWLWSFSQGHFEIINDIIEIW